jgi:hypothetical protein
MLQMVANINQNYISQVQGTGVRVECGTCHARPDYASPAASRLANKIDKEGIEAGLALYNEFRARNYGMGCDSPAIIEHPPMEGLGYRARAGDELSRIRSSQ